MEHINPDGMTSDPGEQRQMAFVSDGRHPSFPGIDPQERTGQKEEKPGDQREIVGGIETGGREPKGEQPPGFVKGIGEPEEQRRNPDGAIGDIQGSKEQESKNRGPKRGGDPVEQGLEQGKKNHRCPKQMQDPDRKSVV